MPINFSFILAVLGISLGVAAIISIVQLLTVRVKISSKHGKGPVVENSFLRFRSGSTAAEVSLISAQSDDFIGHVTVADDLAWVDVRKGEDAAGNAKFKKVGYIDREGFLYEVKKARGPKRIGYLAKPSQPNKPTLEGERTARTLWLYKTLDVYIGDPGTVVEKKKTEKKRKSKAENSGTDEPEVNKPEIKKHETKKPEIKEPEVEKEPVADEEPVAYGDIKTIDDGAVADDYVQPETVGSAKDAAEDAVDSQDAPEDGKDADSDLEKTVIIDSDVQEAITQDLPVRHYVEEDTSGIPEVLVQEPSSDEDELQVEDIDNVADEPDSEEPVPPESSEPSDDSTTQEEDVVKDPELLEEEYLRSVAETCSGILDEIKEQLIPVEGGTFMMGATEQELSGSRNGYKVDANECPAHKVNVDSFCMAKYPVTQRIWTAIMGYNNSEYKNDDYPVAPVTWAECDLFVQRLGKLTGIKFSLPTEAQWEFAARGGNLSKGTIYSGGNEFSVVGCDSFNMPVGSKAPNELGIYDMSGLVREWVLDWYLPYTDAEQDNPCMSAMPEDPELRLRVVRSPAGNCTVTNRKGEMPDEIKYKSYGFRVACEYSPEILPKKTPAVLVGRASKRGVIGSRSTASGFSDESRGAAFAAFDYKFGKPCDEYIGDAPYGWLDTALLSSMIYAVIYMSVYFINSILWEFPMFDIEKPTLSVVVLSLFYFVVWIIVRTIKVACAEAGNSFQPQLDLFNRSRSVMLVDILLLIQPLFCWFDYDFLPVAFAIFMGVLLNIISGKTRALWAVENPYSRSIGLNFEPEDEESEKLMPPIGNDLKEYEWELDPFDKEKGSVSESLVMNFELAYVEKLRTENPFYMEMPRYNYLNYARKMKDYLLSDENASYHTRYLAQEIKAKAQRNKLSELDTAQFALDFVQEPNIKYVEDKYSRNIAQPVEYMRFPDETLYDKEGDCDCKSFLTFMLFHEMGFNVLFMLSSEYQHAAIGLELTDKSWKNVLRIPEDHYLDIVREVNGREYIYCETTGNHFRIGDVPAGESITRYDKIIELLIEEDDED